VVSVVPVVSGEAGGIEASRQCGRVGNVVAENGT